MVNPRSSTVRDQKIAGLTTRDRLSRTARLVGFQILNPAELNFVLEKGYPIELVAADEGYIYDFELLKRALEKLPTDSAMVENVHCIGIARMSSNHVRKLVFLEEDKAFVQWEEARKSLSDFSIASLKGYDRNLRKIVEPRWFDPDKTPKRVIEEHWRNSSEKGTNEWVAMRLHPVPQNLLTTWLWNFPVITPNAVTAFNILISFAAVGFFFKGHFIPGCILGNIVGITDGVDGKLARTTVRFSKFGYYLDHVSDQVCEVLWYLAIGWGLRFFVQWPMDPFLLSWILIAFYTIDRMTTGLFSKIKGVELHDFRKWDRVIRVYGARRNHNFLMLFVGALMDRFAQAFLLVLVYTAMTAFIKVMRYLWIEWKGLQTDRSVS